MWAKNQFSGIELFRLSMVSQGSVYSVALSKRCNIEKHCDLNITDLSTFSGHLKRQRDNYNVIIRSSVGYLLCHSIMSQWSFYGVAVAAMF